MNSNHAILFLDCSKNKMIFGPMFPPAAPLYFVIAKPAAKISCVHFVKKFAKIEMLAFLAEI